MGKIQIGLNAEFSRSSDTPFEWAVKTAAEMGYNYFEPMVHFGRELMSEAVAPAYQERKPLGTQLPDSGLKLHSELLKPTPPQEYQ